MRIWKRGTRKDSPYWGKFNWKGKEINQTTGTANKDEARSVVAGWRANLVLGKPMIESKVPTLAEFLKSRLSASYSDEQENPTSDSDARLLSSSMSKVELDKITSQHTNRFAHQNAHLAGATINQALITLRRALNIAEEWKVLDRAPEIELEKENQRERVLTEEEWNCYLLAMAEIYPWHDVAVIMYSLGMRPESEVMQLRWEQINGKSKTKAGIRRLYFADIPELKNIFDRLFHEQGEPVDGWVFPSESKEGHLTKDSAKNQHKRALVKSGVAAFPPYTLRHTFLTRFAVTVDQFSLKYVAGHSSISTTQRYVHPLQKTIQEGFQRMAKNKNLGTSLGTEATPGPFEEKAKVTVID